MKSLVAALTVLLAFAADAGEFLIAPAETSERSTIGTAFEPRIAAGAAGSLVAWIDHRPPDLGDSWALAGHIRGMRLAADGTRLDERDFEIAFETRGSFSIASDGRDYLVAHPFRVDGGRTVTRLVLVPGEAGAPPRPLDLQFDRRPTELTFAGGHYILSVQDTLHLLDRSGKLVRSSPAFFGANPRPLGLRDGRILLVWTVGPTSRVAVVSFSELEAGLPEGLALGGVYVSSVAEGATGLALLLLGRGDDARVAIVDPEARGTVASVPVEVDREADETATVARLGMGYVVVARLEKALTLVRLNAAGRVLQAGPDTIPSVAPEYVKSAPGAGGSAMVIHSEGYRVVRVQRLALGAEPMLPGEGVIASMSRASQESAAVARCAAFDVVAWLETEGDWRYRVMVRRFAFDGRPLGPAVRVGNAWGSPPAVTCGRKTALVSWATLEAGAAFISGAIVHAFSPPRTLRLTDFPSYSLAVAFDGTHYTGVVPETRARVLQWNERGERTASAEFTLATDFRLRWIYGALDWNGEEFLFVGQDIASGGKMRILGYRLDRNLARVGEPVLIAERYDDAFVAPRVAASPDAWLIAWAGPAQFVGTARIRRDGTRLDPLEGAPAQTRATTRILQLSWSGTHWELVTGDRVISRSPEGSIYDGHVPEDGVSLYGVTHTGASRLLVYSRLDPADGVYELYGRTIGM